jgi:hypothetical protein
MMISHWLRVVSHWLLLFAEILEMESIILLLLDISAGKNDNELTILSCMLYDTINLLASIAEPNTLPDDGCFPFQKGTN